MRDAGKVGLHVDQLKADEITTAAPLFSAMDTDGKPIPLDLHAS